MRLSVLLTIILTAGALILADGVESYAEAKFLKNGVRVGNRTKMTIIRRPSKGVRKRIIRQQERAVPAKPSSGRKQNGRRQNHAWFWKIHSTRLTAASAARWDAALKTMSDRRARGQGIVATDTVRRIASNQRRAISAAAARHGVSEALLIAVIAVESRGKQLAKSPKGAQGLMQLMPATARRFGVTNAYDPVQNIGGGASYLNWLLRQFRGDVMLALAGYNAGEGAVAKHKGVPPYRETRDYVVKVLDALAATQALCGVPLTGPRTKCTLRTEVAG